MGESLTQQRRVKEEILRDVNLASKGRMLGTNTLEMTVPCVSPG